MWYDDQAHYRRMLLAQSETLLLLPDIDTALGLTGTVGDVEAEQLNPVSKLVSGQTLLSGGSGKRFPSCGRG